MAKGSGKAGVVIAPESLGARWVQARAFQSGRPLAAVLERSRPETVFVANELLVDAEDADTLHFLKDEFAAELIPEASIPPLPEGLDPARQRSVDGMPVIVKARLPVERLAQAGGLLGELEQAASEEGEIRVTSEVGAASLALAHRLNREGHPVMLNLVGRPAQLPATSASEAPPGAPAINPYRWNQYSGPTNVARAWQLFQAYEQVKSLQLPVFMAIMDEGFAFDGSGKPMLAGGQPLDVGPYVLWDAISNSGAAGGPYGVANQKWHGTWVFSAGAAPLGNRLGAAGSGGLVARTGLPVVVPLLLRANFDFDVILYGVKLCTAWGMDVLNMSFEVGASWGHHFSSAWERTFQFAHEQGVLLIAAAGNEGAALPDKRIYPATRTPGVITVGGTDNSANPTAAWVDSNHGSSVEIWAPAKGILVMPDPDNGMVGPVDGTSFAAPIVAGVAALMLAVNPRLKRDDILGAMQRTAYKDPNGRVKHALNAYAALLDVMGGRLPDSFEEPNHSPQTARPLASLGGFRWGPNTPTVISDRNDSDWYSFTTQEYTRLELNVRFLPDLGNVFVEVLADDPFSRMPGDLQMQYAAGSVGCLVPTLAPGTYRVRVWGNRPNIYVLRVNTPPVWLAADEFEPNDTQEQAALFYMKVPNPFLTAPLGVGGRFIHFPGQYEATLHRAGEVDWYHFREVSTLSLVESLFEVSRTDAKLDVALFGPDGAVLEPPQTGVRSAKVRLRGPECWVRVSSARLNRYHIYVHDRLNQRMIPGPWEEYDFTPQEFNLPYPADGLLGYEKYYRVELTPELLEIGKLRLLGDAGLALDLIDAHGRQVAAARADAERSSGRIEIDLSEAQPGSYVLRVGRDAEPGQRFDPGITQKLARFRLEPGW